MSPLSARAKPAVGQRPCRLRAAAGDMVAGMTEAAQANAGVLAARRRRRAECGEGSYGALRVGNLMPWEEEKKMRKGVQISAAHQLPPPVAEGGRNGEGPSPTRPLRKGGEELAAGLPSMPCLSPLPNLAPEDDSEREREGEILGGCGSPAHPTRQPKSPSCPADVG